MKALLVTRERVQAAINELTAQGEQVSVRKVQAKLGGGNNTVIGKFLKSQSPSEDANVDDSEVAILRQRVQELERALAERAGQSEPSTHACRVWVDNEGITVQMKDQATFDRIPGHAAASTAMQQKVYSTFMAGKPLVIRFQLF